jgi:RNA polymerase sigma factor (TIGR02999 family)
VRPSPTDVTEALDALRAGDDVARTRLLQAVYAELRRIAHAQRRRERPDHTLNTTALVHEAYLKLLGPDDRHFDNRVHFYGAAVSAMRQVLVEYARARQRLKRGSGHAPLPLDAVPDVADPAYISDTRAAEILDLDDALHRLAALDPRQARIVECRHFGGLSIEETGEILGLSAATVKREWRSARAWLHAVLGDAPTGDAPAGDAPAVPGA